MKRTKTENAGREVRTVKFLCLLGSRLMLYYQKSRLLFLLFCFCGIASSISFLFFYAQLPSVKNRSSEDFYFRQFTVTDILAGLSMEDLTALQEDPMVENVTLIHTGVEGVQERIAASLGDDPGLVRIMGAEDFEGADPYSAILPHTVGYGAVYVGETTTVAGKEFKVIGLCSGISNEVYIPLETYLSLGLSTESAVVYAAEKSDAENGAMTAKLKDVLGGDISIGEPIYVTSLYENASRSGFKNLSITYAVVILVFLFLFLQMVRETGRETAICRIFGATGAKIALLHFCEVLLLTGGSALVGLLLHAALYKPVFSKLNTADIPYYPKDYLLVFAVIIGVTLAVSIPYVIRSLFLSPKEATLTAAK